jgi:hypothetical protein
MPYMAPSFAQILAWKSCPQVMLGRRVGRCSHRGVAGICQAAIFDRPRTGSSLERAIALGVVQRACGPPVQHSTRAGCGCPQLHHLSGGHDPADRRRSTGAGRQVIASRQRHTSQAILSFPMVMVIVQFDIGGHHGKGRQSQGDGPPPSGRQRTRAIRARRAGGRVACASGEVLRG